MARKPQSSRDSRSPRDRLSQDFLHSFAADFSSNGVEVIKALRLESPARYAELAGKLIMQAQEPDDDLSFKSCQDMKDVGAKLLLTYGVKNPTARQVAAAIKLNDKFTKALERLAAGITKNDSAGKQPQANIEHETAMMTAYVDGAEQ